jgi:hypothetical protein
MAIGMRAMNPAAAKPFVPRTLNISLYGLAIDALLDLLLGAAYMFTYAAYESLEISSYAAYVNWHT